MSDSRIISPEIIEAIKEKKVVITIARQYGSGGLTVGKMLSERLGIEYYDKNLIRMASDNSGIHEGLFGESDEKVKKKGILSKAISSVYQGQYFGPDSGDYTSADNLFSIQARVIEELARSQSCIIIGRCADYVLREYENVLSVFVHAPEEFLMEKAAEKLSLTGNALRKFLKDTDRERADYYKHHTGREWTDARNYDLCLDSSKLGFDKCVDEIVGYAVIRFGL